MECDCVYEPEALPSSKPFIIWPVCCHGVYSEMGNVDKKAEPAALDANALIISVYDVMIKTII